MFLTHVESNKNAHYWLGRQAFVNSEVNSNEYNGLYKNPAIPSKTLLRCQTAPTLENTPGCSTSSWRNEKMICDKSNKNAFNLIRTSGTDGIQDRVNSSMTKILPSKKCVDHTFESDANKFRLEWYDSYKSIPPVVPECRWAKRVHVDPSHWPNPSQDPRSKDKPIRKTLQETLDKYHHEDLRPYFPHMSTRRSDPFYCQREKNPLVPESHKYASALEFFSPDKKTLVSSSSANNNSQNSNKVMHNSISTTATHTNSNNSSSNNNKHNNSSSFFSLPPASKEAKNRNTNYITTHQREFKTTASSSMIRTDDPSSQRKQTLRSWTTEEKSLRILPSQQPGGGVKYPLDASKSQYK